MSKPHNLAVVRAKKGKGKRGGVKHMMIKPTDNNGFVTETHFHPSTDEEANAPYNMEPDTAAHADQKAMADHVNATFPPPAKGGAPAGEPEPDGDEGE